MSMDDIPMTARLPALAAHGAVASSPIALYVVPALIAEAGEAASWRYVEFFTANINNPHSQRAYARACNRFFAWCEHAPTQHRPQPHRAPATQR
jgi:hypothetical protein